MVASQVGLVVAGIFIVTSYVWIVYLACCAMARLRRTITEQQTKIDKLKRELEEVKRKLEQ